MDKVLEVVIEVVLTAFVSSLVVGTYVQKLVLKHTTQNEWKKETLSKLLAPLRMELGRNKDTFFRYLKTQHTDESGRDYLEDEIFKKSAERIIHILITHASLIPLHLTQDALKIIQHYDVWLEQYQRFRSEHSNTSSQFVFAGTEGYPFPAESENRFVEYYEQLWNEMYGSDKTKV